jgi:hypothetical protein
LAPQDLVSEGARVIDFTKISRFRLSALHPVVSCISSELGYISILSVGYPRADKPGSLCHQSEWYRMNCAYFMPPAYHTHSKWLLRGSSERKLHIIYPVFLHTWF